MNVCPVCGSSGFTTLAFAEKIDEECRLRERFIRERLNRPASDQELKDLTDFFHQAHARILCCSGCSLLIRDEQEKQEVETYSEDEYDPAVIEHLYPQYLEAFRAKAIPYREMLSPASKVVELGSHYGAFLQTAQEWGWHAEGVDVGKDTTRFAVSKGFTVHHKDLTECHFPDQSYDAVFIWNCFDQISDPKPLLRECRRILKPDGLLTVRVPNGLFYQSCRSLLDSGRLPDQQAQFLIEAMAYNNLLGFPYLYGYSGGTLERLIGPLGFRVVNLLNSELLTLPLPESPEWVEQEERSINDEVRLQARSVLRNKEGVLLGTWIEVSFRCDEKI